MVTGSDYISGLPSADTVAHAALARPKARIAEQSRRDQHRTERYSMLRAKRERILGQKERIEALNEKIGVLEEKLAEAPDEVTKKSLEVQIQKLKLTKAKVEKKAAKRLAKDRKKGRLSSYAIEASHANMQNHIRGYALAQMGATSERDFVDRYNKQRDMEAIWRAKLESGQDPGSFDESTQYVSQSYNPGGDA